MRISQSELLPQQHPQEQEQDYQAMLEGLSILKHIYQAGLVESSKIMEGDCIDDDESKSSQGGTADPPGQRHTHLQNPFPNLLCRLQSSLTAVALPLGSSRNIGELPTYRNKFASPAAKPIGSAANRFGSSRWIASRMVASSGCGGRLSAISKA